MKDLRKYIEENREIFDDKEPTKGHMERFQALLDKQEKNKETTPKRRLISIISVAASIAVLIVVAVKFYAPQSNISDRIIDNPQQVDEFQATNEYYNEQMEAQISDIMCKLSHTDTENQAQLTKDIQKMMDRNADFVEEMGKNEDKEIALHFLVKHYRANIQALENINEKLGKFTNC